MYTVGGVQYDTHEEYLIAQLLLKMGIPFYHHLMIKFEYGSEEPKERLWCPDFIFTKPYRWIGTPCNGSVIIGIEAKRKHIKGKAMNKSRVLCNDYAIPILILNGDNLDAYFQNGALPLLSLAS